jgi:hypothetical protein
MSVSASPEAEAAPGPTSESWRETRSTLKMDPVVPEKAPSLRCGLVSMPEMAPSFVRQTAAQITEFLSAKKKKKRRPKEKPEQGQT